MLLCVRERIWYCAAEQSTIVAPVKFGKPLLNNLLSFDDVQLQK